MTLWGFKGQSDLQGVPGYCILFYFFLVVSCCRFRLGRYNRECKKNRTSLFFSHLNCTSAALNQCTLLCIHQGPLSKCYHRENTAACFSLALFFHIPLQPDASFWAFWKVNWESSGRHPSPAELSPSKCLLEELSLLKILVYLWSI